MIGFNRLVYSIIVSSFFTSHITFGGYLLEREEI